MTTSIALPYKRPAEHRFTVSAWRVDGEDGTSPGIQALQGWDFFTPVSIAAYIEADLRGARQDCLLAESTRMEGVIRWRSSRTNLRGVSLPVELSQGTNSVELTLAGSDLGGRLDLEILVILGSAQETPLGPTRPGSILWSGRRTVALEDDSSRFPVEIVDFKLAGVRGSGALWALQWHTTDLDWSAAAAVRLWLNARHPEVDRLVPKPGGSQALLSFLIYDITRQLIDRALDIEELDENIEFASGTLGAALLERVRSVFPDISISDCRAMRREQTADYETAIQMATQLGRVAF